MNTSASSSSQSGWALVTGASAGIGSMTAQLLAENGYHLILMARRLDRLQELQALIQKKAPQAQVILAVVDVQDRFELSEFVKEQAAVLKKVDVLINAAGLAAGMGKFQDGNLDDFENMMDTNVKGLMYVTRAILPGMIERKSGHIVNIGSVAGKYTYPGGAVYCASKFAVRALTEGLRMDLLGTPIRVTNIEPGMVETEFSLVRLGSKEKADAVYQGMTPLSALDIAETILWSLQRPPHVNIQEIVIYPTDQAHVGQVHRK